MKLRILLSLLLAATIVACSDDDNQVRQPSPEDGRETLMPFSFTISVVNQEGKSLLDGLNPLNVGDISMKYQSRTYPVLDLSTYHTTEGEKRFYGLGLYFDRRSNMHLLMVGEWDGEKTYTNETFTLSWPDGSQDVFRFSYAYRYLEEEKRTEVSTSYFLNDEPHDGLDFTITK